MQLRYSYRVDPQPRHRVAFARASGCARVVFNDGLAARQHAHAAGLPYITDAQLPARLTAFVVETGDDPLPGAGTEIGIDLGLTHFAVLSDGRKVANPRFLRRAERKLRKAQKALSRKVKGSSNRNKARAKVARVHARVADTRRDWLHKESTKIIRETQAVYVEDLCVAGLGRTRLAKSVHDAGWPAFTAMLEYKARRHGRTFGRTGRWEPTSQVCSACGIKDGPKPLSVRQWTCAACGAVHDRDVNAALNILALGRRDRLNACGGDVRPGPALAVARETGSHRGAA
jgi:IS605 OrfB family transposase